MKRQKGLILASSLLLAFTLASCGGSSTKTTENTSTEAGTTKEATEETTEEAPIEAEPVEFTLGSWNGNTFENQWLNMSITAPEGSVIATDEEIAELMGVGTEILAASLDANADAMNKINELKTSYGFMIYDETQSSNAILAYDNLAMTPGGTDMSADEYLDATIETVLAADLGYEVLNQDPVELAGKEFSHAKVSLFDGAAYQDYYLYRDMNDDHIACLILTYTEDTKPAADALIDSITTLE